MNNLFKAFGVIILVIVFLTVVHEAGHALMVKKVYAGCNPKIWFGINLKMAYTDYTVPSSCISNVKDFKVIFAGFWMELVVGLLVAFALVLVLFFEETMNYGFGESWRFWALLIVFALLVSMWATMVFYITPYHPIYVDMKDMVELVNMSV